MLRLTLDLHPGGGPVARHLATLDIWNTSGLAPRSNYGWRLTASGSPDRHGVVTDHRRSDGWEVLVARVMDGVVGDQHAGRRG